MADKKIEEHEDEVFIWDDGKKSRSLVTVGKDGTIFSLTVQLYCGKITEERKKEMKSIGVFSVYD